MMNIDQQIKEILSKSCPINDNCKKPSVKAEAAVPCQLNSVSIVGSHNIIVSSNILLWGLFLLINTCALIYLLK